MTIYMLTIGEYEDERIVGLFDDIEKAEKIKNSLDDFNEIEEWELNPDIYIEENKSIYNVHVLDYYIQVQFEQKNWFNVCKIGNLCYDIYNKPYTYVWASSKKEAIEVFKKMLDPEWLKKVKEKK